MTKMSVIKGLKSEISSFLVLTLLHNLNTLANEVKFAVILGELLSFRKTDILATDVDVTNREVVDKNKKYQI